MKIQVLLVGASAVLSVSSLLSGPPARAAVPPEQAALICSGPTSFHRAFQKEAASFQGAFSAGVKSVAKGGEGLPPEPDFKGVVMDLTEACGPAVAGARDAGALLRALAAKCGELCSKDKGLKESACARGCAGSEALQAAKLQGFESAHKQGAACRTKLDQVEKLVTQNLPANATGLAKEIQALFPKEAAEAKAPAGEGKAGEGKAAPAGAATERKPTPVE